MKPNKLKTKKNTKKDKIVITTIITFLISSFITSKISFYISKNILYAAESYLETENDLIFKKAYIKKNEAGVDVENLIYVVRNSKGEIVEVDFKILECEKLLMAIMEEINKNTDEIMTYGYNLNVPLGYITNSPLLINLGPKIPVKISTTDVALGDVSTKITDFGINNAMVEVYINFSIKVNALTPLNKKTKELNYSALIASKIINGTVPNFYSGTISRTSETFNLPINGNM